MCDEFVDTGSVNALRNRPIPAGRSQAAAKRRVCHQGEPARSVSFEESVLLSQCVREIRTSEACRRKHVPSPGTSTRVPSLSSTSMSSEPSGGRAGQRKPACKCVDKQLHGHRDLKTHTRNVVSAPHGSSPHRGREEASHQRPVVFLFSVDPDASSVGSWQSVRAPSGYLLSSLTTRAPLQPCVQPFSALSPLSPATGQATKVTLSREPNVESAVPRSTRGILGR